MALSMKLIPTLVLLFFIRSVQILYLRSLWIMLISTVQKAAKIEDLNGSSLKPLKRNLNVSDHRSFPFHFLPADIHPANSESCPLIS
jgi:hypothetical protein